MKLIDVCERVTDGSHHSPKTQEVGYPYITVRDVDDFGINFVDCKFVSKSDFEDLKRNGCAPKFNDLLFSKDGTVGKVAIVNTEIEFVVLSSLAIITPNLELVDPTYLYYVLKSPNFLATAIGKKTGAAIRRIILKNLKDIAIPVPHLSVQKKIISKLDVIFSQLDGAMTAVEENIINSETLFKSYLVEIFESGKKSWSYTQLGSVCKTSAGGTPLKARKEYYENGDIPWLLSGEVCKKEIFASVKFITKAGLENSSARLFPIDTTLVAMYGATAGQVGILKFPSTTNQAVCGILPNEKYLPEFLYYYLSYYKDTLLLEASGVAQPNLSQIKIKNIPLPIIAVEVQGFLVKKLDAISRQIELTKASYIKKIDKLSDLRNSILQHAFNGELIKD